jgi:Ser/Thr protein kinase RdoA (MazF antagonist)
MAAVHVLAQYPTEYRPGKLDFLGGAGGFSGALFWSVDSSAGRLCLRRWPSEHPTRQRLRFIHAVLRHVHALGCGFVPVPRTAAHGDSFVEWEGCLWELAPWMPGQADYRQRPTPLKLANAMKALAQFHLAAATIRVPEEFAFVSPGPSPGILERRRQLTEILGRGGETLSRAIESGARHWPELAERGRRLVAALPIVGSAVREFLEHAAALAVPLFPCLRDVWHDHVLFSGENVSGMVDFGALRVESPAADIARLVGSLAGEDHATREAGLAAYRTVRPLSVNELDLAAAFDRSGALLGAANWMQWVFIENRRFGERDVVIERVDELMRRLRAPPRL